MNGNPVTPNPANNAMVFLAGAVLGAGVTLLMAPAAGSETRKKIGDTARRLGKGAADKFGQVKDAVTQSVNGELEEVTASARSSKRA